MNQALRAGGLSTEDPGVGHGRQIGHVSNKTPRTRTHTNALASIQPSQLKYLGPAFVSSLNFVNVNMYAAARKSASECNTLVRVRVLWRPKKAAEGKRQPAYALPGHFLLRLLVLVHRSVNLLRANVNGGTCGPRILHFAVPWIVQGTSPVPRTIFTEKYFLKTQGEIIIISVRIL